MKIDITDIIERNGAVLQYEMDLDSHETGGGMSQIDFVGKMHIKGSVKFLESILTVTANIKSVLSAKCYRCMKDVEKPFSIDMEEIFEPANSPKSLNSYEYSGYMLDITQAVIDAIYLNIPRRILCKDDCKGLCPVCGCDLNDAQCDCLMKNRGNSDFDGLKDMFKQ
jgi:uncharacterized protein